MPKKKEIQDMDLKELQVHATAQAETIAELESADKEFKKLQNHSSAQAEKIAELAEATKEFKKLQLHSTAQAERIAELEAAKKELTAENTQLTTLNDELSGQLEVSGQLKADVYMHEGKAYKAIGPKFRMKGEVITSKELNGNTALIAACIEAKLLVEVANDDQSTNT